MLNKLFTSLFLFAIIFGAVPARPVHAATVSLSEIQPGDLFRGPTFPAVYYYGNDGFRYVFPNDKTYFTWYADFSNIKWVSDSDLGKIQIGGNVTYKPGVKMVKINTDPKTYAVAHNGSLRWVNSESAAVALYGQDWSDKIDDVPDGFFTNYEVSDDDIENDTDFDISAEMAMATDINVDKELTPFIEIDITDNAYSDVDIVINPGDVVRWVNNGADRHTATADDLEWGSGTISANGGFWQRRFDEVGEFTYFCSYHPEMTGAITVEI